MQIPASQDPSFNEIQLRDSNEETSIPAWMQQQSGSINKKIYDAYMMPLIF